MQNPETFYGGSVLAMAGKDCVCVVSDFRLGAGPITTSKSFQRVFRITDRIVVGLPIFVPDAQMLLNKVKKHVALFKLTEGREIEPEECANLISAILYSYRKAPLYTSPIVAGLDSEKKAYICEMDCLGCKTEPGSFVAEGTASKNLMGMCEVLYRDDMDEEDLFTTGVQAFLNAVDRDAQSGWGAECIILTSEKCIVRSVKGRCD
ncbi:proteasome core particle subunit beta 3 [Glugoides intestinalis]